MVFEVPASKASKNQDKFEFTVPGTAGKFFVRKYKFLPIGELEKIQDDAAYGLEFFGKAGTKQGAAIRTLDREQFQALVVAWRADSEVTEGESPASGS